MAVAITGGTGFLGARLATAFAAAGMAVVILTRPGSDLRRLAGLPVEIRQIDSPEALAGVTTVIHAAASYGRAGEPASSLLEANLLKPVELLERAQQADVKRWITVGTALPEALSAYARSKHQFLPWAEALAGSGGPAHVWLACEHFYGPGDDEAKFVTRCLRSLLRQVPTLPLTSGRQKRDFIHVDDAVAAIRHLVELPHLPSASCRLPLGSGLAIPVRHLVERLHALIGGPTHLDFGAVPTRAGEPLECRADLTAMAALGWHPSVNLEDGLAQTVAVERSLAV
jgi:CDP-paratose synthetase